MNWKTSNSCLYHFLRLTPGQDVRGTLHTYCKDKNIKAAAIISAVGSLNKVKLRKASSESFYESNEPHELLSFSGLLSTDGVHIHVSVADKNATVFGGHLSEGNVVYTTLELVIADFPDVTFLREKDPKTGYLELSIK